MSVDLAAIRNRMEQLQGNRRNSKIQLWKPDPGTYKVRGLPRKNADPSQPFTELWFYYLEGFPGIMAPRQFNKPDPINELISSLYQSGKPDDREIAKKLRPKMRAYMPIIVREENGVKISEPRVQLWSFGKLVYQRLLGFFLKEDVGDFLDVNDGFDLEVTISKIEGRMFNDTAVDLARRPSALADSDEKIKALLDSVPDPVNMYKQRSVEEIERMLQQWLNGDDPNSPALNESNGASRNVSKTDALDDLANEVSGKKNNKAEEAADDSDDSDDSDDKRDEKPESKKQQPKKQQQKASAKKKGKDDSDELDGGDTQNQSLDDAFDELMKDD